MIKFYIFTATLILTCRAAKLPSYINRCRLDDNLSKCIADNIPVIRPHLDEGIRELAIPPLAPFHMPELTIDSGPNLKIKMTDLKIYHLNDFELQSIKVNATTYIGELKMHFDKIRIEGIYDVDGQILVLPIKGHGPANISINNFDVTYMYSVKPQERKGKTYMLFETINFIFQSGKISLHLDNLFNGDKVLSDQVNDFLNDNWRDVEGLLRPAISETVIALVGAIFEKISKSMPMNEILLID